MDLYNLETLANKISPDSPAMKKWALEQVRITKIQEVRLLAIEAALVRVQSPVKGTLGETIAAVRALKGK